MTYYSYIFCLINITEIALVGALQTNLALFYWVSYWIIYSNDSFTALIRSRSKHVSESLNNSLKWYVHIIYLFKNKTSDCTYESVNESFIKQFVNNTDLFRINDISNYYKWLNESFNQMIHSQHWLIREQTSNSTEMSQWIIHSNELLTIFINSKTKKNMSDRKIYLNDLFTKWIYSRTK